MEVGGRGGGAVNRSSQLQIYSNSVACHYNNHFFTPIQMVGGNGHAGIFAGIPSAGGTIDCWGRVLYYGRTSQGW